MAEQREPPNVFDNRDAALLYLKKAGEIAHEIVVWKSKDGMRWSVIPKRRAR